MTSIKSLEERYARLLADLAAVPKAVRHANLPAGWAVLDNREAEIRADLAALERSIRMIKPSWDPKSVKPLRTKEKSWLDHGKVSKTALVVLRIMDRPMTTAEIAEGVARRLKLGRLTEAKELRLKRAINSALKPRIGGIIVASGARPRRWSLVPREKVAEAAVWAPPLDAANSPSNRET